MPLWTFSVRGRGGLKPIHSKSEKVGGFCIPVQINWRKKMRKSGRLKVRQRCVNHEIFKNLLTKGHIFDNI